MNDNVIPFTGATTADLKPDAVLEGAVGKVENCIVIGDNFEGGLYFASSLSKAKDISWLLEKARRRLMQVVMPENED